MYGGDPLAARLHEVRFFPVHCELHVNQIQLCIAQVCVCRSRTFMVVLHNCLAVVIITYLCALYTYQPHYAAAKHRRENNGQRIC